MDASKDIYKDFGDIIKHEARLKLWLPLMVELHKRLGRKLKYFTLPGPKAYDVIRWRMADLIEYDGRGYPGVCFCDEDNVNFINAKRILGNTRGVKDKFENIIKSEKKDTIYKPFWDLFPYDVYNLDFCGTWFEDEEPLSETFMSIVKLIKKHILHRKFTDFIVFLTIRIDRGKTNNEVIKNLVKNLKDNLKNDNIYKQYKRYTGYELEKMDKFVRDKFNLFMLISLPKTIAFKIIQFATGSWAGKITKFGRACYPRDGRYHIGKFAFVVSRERTNLINNPEWYETLVKESINLNNTLMIDYRNVSRDTKVDLEKLKMEISKIEDYE